MDIYSSCLIFATTNFNKKYMVAFISLGPGDPELVTMKSLKLLRKADVVWVPATDGALSHAKDNTFSEAHVSRAAQIISYWDIKVPIKTFPIPMTRDGKEAMAMYDRMCQELYLLHQERQRVVVAVEGDVSIYASIHYVADRLTAMGIPVTQVPGITSFIAAAATARLSLVSHEERLLVVPGDVTDVELANLMRNNHTLVIMKLTKCEAAVKLFMMHHPNHAYYYFEDVGCETEFCSSDPEWITRHEFPYFSLMIIKR